LENKGHACYFAVAAWLSNFCHGLATLSVHSVQKWGLYENKKVLRIGEEGEKKWQAGENIGKLL